jgi:hypothetical protein
MEPKAVETEDMVALATEFAELASQIEGDGRPDEGWRRVADLAVKYVQGCSWVSITDVESGRPRTLVASDPIALSIDTLQYESGEGPCMESAADNSSVLVPDIQAEYRWPTFSSRAATETPLGGMLAIRLPGHEHAAMNFYSDGVASFDDDAIAAASILAAHAASLLYMGSAAESRQNLQDALGSNRQIGMAIGILMAHYKITQDDAFDLLRSASHALHRKVRDIAVEVTQTGLLPELPRRRSTGTLAAG